MEVTNYDTIILEMLSRIQALEQEVETLKGQYGAQLPIDPVEKITTTDIQKHIEQLKEDAIKNKKNFLQIKANEIHRTLRLKSRFPMVCNAMRKCMREGDVVVHETPSGCSSTLEIRYYLNCVQTER